VQGGDFFERQRRIWRRAKADSTCVLEGPIGEVETHLREKKKEKILNMGYSTKSLIQEIDVQRSK